MPNNTNRSLKKFLLKNALPDRVFLIIGKRGSGKSILLRDLLYRYRSNIDFALAMTQTVPTRDMLCKHIAKPYVRLGGYDENVAERFLDICTKISADKRDQPRHMALVLDDCMGSDSGRFLKGKVITDLCLNGRHYHSALMLTTQYALMVPPAVRANCDYVFVLAETSVIVRKKIYQQFFGIFTTFAEFDQYFKVATENHSALVLDATTGSNKVKDCVFWYKADKHLPDDFKIGRSCYFKRRPTVNPESKRV